MSSVVVFRCLFNFTILVSQLIFKLSIKIMIVCDEKSANCEVSL